MDDLYLFFHYLFYVSFLYSKPEVSSYQTVHENVSHPDFEQKSFQPGSQEKSTRQRVFQNGNFDDLLNDIGLSSVRAYFAATNLFYIMGSDYTGYNPEGIKNFNGGGDSI